MPVDAFSLMWHQLKAGKSWLGIVKNRCKNGDHYWVNAYVTPLKDGHQIADYESVRVKADQAVINRAEKVYARLNNGQPPIHWTEKTLPLIKETLKTGSLIAIAITCFLFMISEIQLIHFIQGVGLSFIAGILISYYSQSGLRTIVINAKQEINDDIAAYICTGDATASGHIELAQMALKMKLRVALGRFQ